MQVSALRIGRVFDVRRSAGIGGKVVAACQVSLRLDAELGIVNGETKHFLDSGYYVYLSVSEIDEDRFHYDVPYPTYKSLSLEKEADSDGDNSVAADFDVELVLHDGTFISIPTNDGMTAEDLKWEISKRTRKKPDDLKLSASGLPLPDGPLHRLQLGGPIQVLERLTGGGGKRGPPRSGKKVSARKKKSARRAANHRQRVGQLSYLETLEIMSKRENKMEETTEHEVESIMKDMVCEQTRSIARQAELDYDDTIVESEVPLYGTLDPTEKPLEVVRLMSLNINGIQMNKSANPKAERLKHIISKYGIDVLGMQETCVNWSKYKSSLTIASLLRARTEPIRSTHSFNKLETDNIGYVQRGGTATVAIDTTSTYVKGSGSDHTQLGRWSYYLLEGAPGHKTRVITAYAPCGSSSSGLSTNWKAQQRYIQQHGIRTRDPKQMFEDDLCAALRQWREQGDRLILMMDANENVYSGKFGQRLSEEGIDLKEAVHAQTKGQGPHTHNRGSQPIDGIWFTPDLELTGASYLPFDGSLGDHRPVVADFSQRSVLGTNLPKVVPVTARRLNSKVARIRDNYTKRLEESFRKNNIIPRLQRIEKDVTFPASENVEMELERIDQEMEEMMLSAERSCRKLYAAHYDFSPTVQFWLKRCHAYRALIKLKGIMEEVGSNNPQHPRLRNKNIANTFRSAERAGIRDASELSKKDLMVQYGYCREQTKRLLAESPWLRKQFLSRKLEDAKINNDEKEAKRTQEMLRREAHGRTWKSIQRVTKPKQAGAVTFVDVQQADGTTIRHDEQEPLEQAIAGEIIPRFCRASNAPICQGALFNLLGYSANSETAVEILEGRFVPPPGTDGPTVLLLEEIARIWSQMEAGQVDIVVTKDDFQHFWKRMNERTASSYSKLHIGHYKAAAYSDELSTAHSLKLSLISQAGAAPERWSRGLSVMLEKIAGVALVTKLRAILLMEADFNYHNKLIFGKRMLDLARAHNLVPDEIYSEKGRTAEDAILHQVLAYDIARQKRAPFIVASVDAAQCYDRIAHAMAALTLRASKVPDSSVHCMLKPIREMEFYIRTAFGESSTYVGGKELVKQGGCQGNGAAPPTWQQIATIMIKSHRRAGHGVEVRCPISKKSCHKVGILYVDDTNIWAGLDPDDDLIATAAKAQEAVDSWGNLLMATGGALNPKKCFWTIHDMAPRSDGTWEYRRCKPALETIAEGNEMPGTNLEERDEDRDGQLDELEMTIPQIGGDVAAITQLQASQATENLGLLAAPDGNPQLQFDELGKKMDKWTERIKDGHLPARSNWLSYQCQLWPGLRYGLGASAATIDQLEKGLGSRDHKLLSQLGICRNIPVDLRYLPSYFGGFGLKSLKFEATTESINMFLQHYGTESTLGVFLTATIENLQLELGVTGCPFTYEYSIWNGLATESWVKSLWERLQHFNIDMQIDYKVLPMPRVNDECIMESCVDNGIRGAELAGINRARKHQEAMFLSDIAAANGQKIEESYLSDWMSSYEFSMGKHRSQFEFGAECPTNSDWDSWSNYWNSQCNGSPAYRLPFSLGGWRAESPRIWRTFYDEEENRIEVLSDERGVVYFEYGERGRFVERDSDNTATPRGIPATVQWLPNGNAKLLNLSRDNGVDAITEEATSLREHLKSWGGDWMWRDLRIREDPIWVSESLAKGTLVCVTDGSYNKVTDPEICSAGWIIQCRETGKSIVGTVLERSPSAGSYRGELLGMLAIKLFLLAVEEFYQTVSSGNKICCDNKGALFTFGKKSKRVPKGRSNSDIHRVVRTINSRMKSKYLQKHVKAHQDDHSLLRNLSFEAQLNCLCDKLAKDALTSYWHGLVADYEGRGPRLPQQPRFPLEAARVYIEGMKQTTDVSKGLTYAMGRTKAREYYSSTKNKKNQISTTTFDCIDFPALQSALRGKPQMYQVWYAKQTSGWCATGAKLAQWDSNADSRCPNCHCLDEDADHIIQCRSAHRTALLMKSISELGDWMKDNGTHPGISKLVCLYLSGRGQRSFSSPLNIPDSLKQLCREQDELGWRNFLEGRISTQFRAIQSRYLRVRHPRRTVDTWLRGFASNLLSITHSQWIFRCISKHHSTKGTKALATREALLTEIERQKQLGSEALSENDQWMLEVDVEDETAEDQQYWLFAVEAARQAGAHALEASNGSTSEWSEIVDGEEYQHIASQNPPPTPPSSMPRPDVEAKEDRPKKTVRTIQVKPSRTKEPKLKCSVGHCATKPPTQRLTRPRPQPRTNYCSGAARTSDSCNLLQPFRSRILQDRKLVRKAFDRPPRLLARWSEEQGRQVSTEQVAYKYANQSMVQTEFKLLEGTAWLSDANINMFLQAYVTDKVERAHCFSTHFFVNLFSTCNPNTNDINFSAVSNHSAVFGGLAVDGCYLLDDLYIPTHVGENHWIMIRVNFKDSAIELFDSMGSVNPRHTRYMEGLRRYLFEDLHKEMPDHQRPSYSEWSRTWRLSNRSRHSPRQTNGYDCGVFTMISIYLSSRSVILSRETYDQRYVEEANLRHNVALALLRVNEETDPSDTQARLTFRRAASSHPRGKKRSREHRVCAAGGKRIKTKTSVFSVSSTLQVADTLNRKRTAKSLTDNDPTQQSLLTMFSGPGAKRRKKKTVQHSP